jgi:hypothetical protein
MSTFKPPLVYRVWGPLSVDNVVRKGEILDGTSTDVSVHGIRRLTELGR